MPNVPGVPVGPARDVPETSVPRVPGVPSGGPALGVPAASPRDGCRVTMIEKTSPAFVIPHVEEKHRVETDEDVMRDFYTR